MFSALKMGALLMTPRTTAQISPLLSARLNAYALAASGISASLLAFAQPSEAEVVYTPTHITFAENRAQYRLDINGDGKSDFTFTLINGSLYSSFSVVNELNGGPTSNAFLVAAGKNGFPLPLNAGAPIGPGKNFFGSIYAYEFLAFEHKSSHGGDWINARNRYLGLKFIANGNTYYGWARLSVKAGVDGSRMRAVLTGYAYENIPDRGIRAGQTSGTVAEPVYGAESAEPQAPIALPVEKPASQSPQPATLGMLALGAPGVHMWRSDEPAN
jgi:hypothetical protein